MSKRNIKGPFMLLMAAAIWGFAFVAQSTAMDKIGPFTFQAVRSLLGALILLPVIIIKDKALARKENNQEKKIDKNNKGTLTLLTGGILCGIALAAACCFQQFGICYTTASKSGFITAMYILIVPLAGLFFKKKVSLKIWICVLVAVVGMYLLCVKEGLSINIGDALTFVCSVFFSIQIMLVDYYSPKVDGVKLSCIQFLVTAIISGILMFIFEEPSVSDILSAWLPIVYAGVCSCGVAYTLQILGQKYTEPTVASLIMSFESVFATIGGVVILKEIPGVREWVGIGLMFVAIIVSQISLKKISNS